MKSCIYRFKDEPALVLRTLCDCVLDPLTFPHVELNFELSERLFLLNFLSNKCRSGCHAVPACLFEAQQLYLMDSRDAVSCVVFSEL